MWLSNQDLRSRSCDYPLKSIRVRWTLYTIFIKLHPKVSLGEAMCTTYDLTTQRSCDLPFNSCQLHISWTLWMILLKLHWNVPHGKMVCRAHNQLPRLTVTGQGHGIYPWISCLLHIYWTLRAIFIKLQPIIPLHWDDVQYLWLSYADSRSRPHFKAMLLTLQFISAL